MVNGSCTNIEGLDLVSKIYLYELHISYKLFSTHGLEFNYESCFKEIEDLNRECARAIRDNNLFFDALFNDVKKIIKNRDFRTRFSLNLGELDPVAYTTIIIKSIFLLENISLVEETDLQMLHRNVVEKNIKKYSKVFRILNLNASIKANIYKIIMLLSEYVDTKKITLRRKNKIKTDFYLKFNIICQYSYSDRILMSYSRVEFQRLGNNLIGASYLTLNKTIKKSNWQLDTNTFNPLPILILSKKKINMDLSF